MTIKELEREKQYLEIQLSQTHSKVDHWRNRAMKAEDFILHQYKEAMKFMQIRSEVTNDINQTINQTRNSL